MARLEWTGDGGTDGAQVTLANSGDPGNGNAFDLEAGLASACLYDDDSPAPFYGRNAAAFNVTSGNTRQFAWTSSWSSKSQVWYRYWIYKSGNPTNSTSISQLGGAGGADGCDVRITSTGTLQFRNGELVATLTSAALANATLHRIEGWVLHSDTVGRMMARIYSGTNALYGTVPNQTLGDTTTNRDTDASSQRMNFGVMSNPGAAGLVMWMKGIALSDEGWIGGLRRPRQDPRSRSNFQNVTRY